MRAAESPSSPQPTPHRPGGCGHIPPPKAETSHGLTCFLDPRARVACQPPPRPQRAEGSSRRVWVGVIAGECASVSSVGRCVLKRKCEEPDKSERKKKIFF